MVGIPQEHKQIYAGVFAKCLEHFRVEDGVLYYSAVGASKVSKCACPDRPWRVVVRTEEEKKRIMQSCHSSAHGKNKLSKHLFPVCFYT